MHLRVQQVNQYMTVMEVFEWVGRKFAVRDKVDRTQKYQGGGHQRRERVTKKTESLPALSPGTPASSMDEWGPESEDDRRPRPATPRRHGRSAQRSETPPRRSGSATPAPAPPAAASRSGGVPEGAVATRPAAAWERATPTPSQGPWPQHQTLPEPTPVSPRRQSRKPGDRKYSE